MVVSLGRTGMGRRVLLMVLLLLLVAFLIHGVAMGPHHVADSGCGTCVTAILLLVAVAVLVAEWTSRVVSVAPSARREPLPAEAPPRSSRHPPDDGTVLRL
ncbi:MAG: hypothetical protein WEA29_04800 [Acidimicrobiia bacterium]